MDRMEMKLQKNLIDTKNLESELKKLYDQLDAYKEIQITEEILNKDEGYGKLNFYRGNVV